ncbi:MAG: ATP-binding protein, partial [Chloroflexi bacterium]|nr:ATP-binding protein [Chloroflexota bacterium]
MELLERGLLLDELGRQLAACRHGRGRFVLIEGEAGIGKSALLDGFLAERTFRTRVLRGACRPSLPARPFNPFHDLTGPTSGDLGTALRHGGRDRVIDAVLALLRPGSTTILAIEDLHWADDATLDSLSVIAQIVHERPALVLATCRDDELVAGHPMERVITAVPASALARLRYSQTSSQPRVDASIA